LKKSCRRIQHTHWELINTHCSHLKTFFKQKFRPKYALKCFIFWKNSRSIGGQPPVGLRRLRATPLNLRVVTFTLLLNFVTQLTCYFLALMLRFFAIKITTYYFILERRLVGPLNPASPPPPPPPKTHTPPPHTNGEPEKKLKPNPILKTICWSFASC